MESGPLPPHERSWRHPSEVAAAARAAEAQEAASPVARNTALLGAAASMAVIALLVMVVTPSRGGSPIAVSSTTAPLVSAAASAGPTIGGSQMALVVTDATAELPRATPIAGTDLAVVTRQALAGVAVARWSAPAIGGGTRESSDRLEVTTPSGTAIAAVIDEQPDDDVVIVELVDPPAGATALPLAERSPSADDHVVVMADEPVEVAFDELDTLEVPEGTAVLDADGKLVGLCSGRGGRTSLLTLDGWAVSDEPDAAKVGAPTTSTTPRPADQSAALDD